MGNGYHKLVAKHTDSDPIKKVLNVESGINANGRTVNLYEDNGSSAQQWKIESISTAGARENFEKISLKKPENDFTIFPNPASGKVTVALTANQEGLAKIQFLDLMSRPILTKTQAVRKGLNRVEFNTSTLRNGIYSIQISLVGQRIVKKVTINK